MKIDIRRYSVNDPVPDISSAQLHLLTDEIDSGKTTCIRRWLHEWRKNRIDIFGVVSESVIENGVKVGYDLLDIRTGERRGLIRSQRFQENWQLGRFHFDRRGFARLIEGLLSQRGDLLILDEIGPLELRRKQGFYPLLRHFLQNKENHTRLLIVTRRSEIDALKTTLNQLA
ncbi:MAG: hypothetical protein B6244_08710 [Candidatus Cloacimonetes bacterium 4572_55]|nr:MAG: hypothetical protein B6244_08710 [Candidatus Cloacimonetes bacterium 4572_55]